jgi:hypothetical protein
VGEAALTALLLPPPPPPLMLVLALLSASTRLDTRGLTLVEAKTSGVLLLSSPRGSLVGGVLDLRSDQSDTPWKNPFVPLPLLLLFWRLVSSLVVLGAAVAADGITGAGGGGGE